MRNVKKALGIVMILAMLLNVVALAAYAAIPSDTVCEVTVEADKATYAPGDEITLTIYGQTSSSCPGIEMAGQYIFGYDSAGIERYSDSVDLTQHGFTPAPAHAAAFDNSMSQIALHHELIDMGTTVSNGDMMIGYFIAEDGATYVPAIAERVELFSVKMRVSATAAPGDYTIAFNRASWDDGNCYIQDELADGLYGAGFCTPADLGYSESTMFAFKDVTIHVGAAGPVVDKAAQQVKFTPAGADVADDFKLRVKSVITDADWDAYFANTGTPSATTNAIQAVGIVAYQGTAGFDAEVAKGVVNGTPAASYAAAETTYIQKVDDASDAYFGAIVNLKHSTCDYDITYMGFVKYLDDSGAPQVIFYPASYVAGVSTNYETAKNAFLGA